MPKYNLHGGLSLNQNIIIRSIACYSIYAVSIWLWLVDNSMQGASILTYIAIILFIISVYIMTGAVEDIKKMFQKIPIKSKQQEKVNQNENDPY